MKEDQRRQIIINQRKYNTMIILYTYLHTYLHNIVCAYGLIATALRLQYLYILIYVAFSFSLNIHLFA